MMLSRESKIRYEQNQEIQFGHILGSWWHLSKEKLAGNGSWKMILFIGKNEHILIAF